MHRRRLIINADDFGLTRGVNLAIEELCDAGRLGGVSLLATGEAFEEAVAAIRAYPRVGVGIHLNAVEGAPLTREAAPLLDRAGRFAGLASVLLRCLARPTRTLDAIEHEWRAQIARAQAAGLTLSHADSHQHSHAFPALFALAARLCREYGIPALRIPREALHPSRRPLGALGLRACLTLSRPETTAAGLRYNDFFLGFGRAGHYTLDALQSDLRALRPGLTELSVHPSIENHAPYRPYRSNDERKALLDAKLLDSLRECEIESTSWNDAGFGPAQTDPVRPERMDPNE